MALEHSTLTGSQLHEPKGVTTAAENSVYVADGAGSGSWTPIITSPSFGEMTITSNLAPFTCAANNTYEHLVNTGWAAGLSADVTVNADDVQDNIVFATTGTYSVQFWAVIESAAADGTTISFKYAVDGILNGRIVLAQKNSTGTDYLTVSAAGLANMSAGQNLKIFVATSASASAFTILDAGLTVIRIN
jgi:hypothetical protein